MEDFHLSRHIGKFDRYRTGKSRGLKTGFENIDARIKGLPQLVVVQGEPKCCKSTFTLSIAISQARSGTPVFIIDRENGLHRMQLRTICHMSGLTDKQICRKKMKDSVQKKYDEAVAELGGIPLFYANIVDKEEVAEVVAELRNQFGKQVLIVVDSIQGMSIMDGSSEKRSIVDSWLYFLRDLKLKYNWLTIVIVSEKKQSAYGVAALDGAKESGSIGYQGELTLDLYRSKEDDKIMAEVVLNRDGGIGVVDSFIVSNPFNYRLESGEYLEDM